MRTIPSNLGFDRWRVLRKNEVRIENWNYASYVVQAGQLFDCCYSVLSFIGIEQSKFITTEKREEKKN